jgi:hypothetical protein
MLLVSPSAGTMICLHGRIRTTSHALKKFIHDYRKLYKILGTTMKILGPMMMWHLGFTAPCFQQ